MNLSNGIMVLINYQIKNDLIKLLNFYQALDVIEILHLIKYSEITTTAIQIVYQLVGIEHSDDILDILSAMNKYKERSPSPSSYFELTTTYQHHTNIPDQQPIYDYSFALQPEENWQPTGTVNYSRLDAQPSLQYTPYEERNPIILGYQKRWMYKRNFDML